MSLFDELQPIKWIRSATDNQLLYYANSIDCQ